MWRYLLAAILSTELQLAHAEEVLRIAYFADYQPISWGREDAMRGVLIDIVDEALVQRMGVAVDQRGYPWARAQAMVRSGNADALITVSTPERREYTIASDEVVLSADIVAFAATGSPRHKELEQARVLSDLKPLLLGSYLGNSWVNTHLADYKIYRVPNLSTVLQMLRARRVDALVEAAPAVRFKIHELHMENDIVELPLIFDSVQFRLCIRKDSPFVSKLPEFDRVIRAMRKDGSLDRIYKKYWIGMQ